MLACLMLGFTQLAVGADSSAALREIASALQSHAYTQAAELAGDALKKWPGDVRLLSFRGAALAGLGDESRARETFTRALKIAPDYVPALEGAAKLEYKAESNRAIPLLDRLIALRPKDEAAQMMRAVIASRQGDCPSAVEHFASAPVLLASHLGALEEYGVCLVIVRQLPLAAATFEHLTALEPDNAGHRYRLAAVRLMSDENRKAIYALRPLLKTGQADVIALRLAAAAWEALGDTPAATKALREAIVAAPRDVQSYVDLTSLCLAHDSYQTGLEIADAGLAQVPASAQIHLARGLLYLQLSSFDKADADFAAAESLDPEQAVSSEGQVLEKLRQGDAAGALVVVDERLKQYPHDGSLYYLRAQALVRQGALPGAASFEQAIQAARRAVELRPDLAMARNLLSRLYLDAGKFDLAIAQCRLVLKDNPNDQVALYRLVRALKASGKPADAAQVPDILRKFAGARDEARSQAVRQTAYRLFVSSSK